MLTSIPQSIIFYDDGVLGAIKILVRNRKIYSPVFSLFHVQSNKNMLYEEAHLSFILDNKTNRERHTGRSL